MNPFELITDDHVIWEMCKQWDDRTLLNMSQAYRRVNDVCQGEITNRKIKQIVDNAKLILTFKDVDESYTSRQLVNIAGRLGILRRTYPNKLGLLSAIQEHLRTRLLLVVNQLRRMGLNNHEISDLLGINIERLS